MNMCNLCTVLYRYQFGIWHETWSLMTKGSMCTSDVHSVIIHFKQQKNKNKKTCQHLNKICHTRMKRLKENSLGNKLVTLLEIKIEMFYCNSVSHIQKHVLQTSSHNSKSVLVVFKLRHSITATAACVEQSCHRIIIHD